MRAGLEEKWGWLDERSEERRARRRRKGAILDQRSGGIIRVI